MAPARDLRGDDRRIDRAPGSRRRRATRLASEELARIGPMKRDERMMLLVFALVSGRWMTTPLHHIDYTVVALVAAGAPPLIAMVMRAYFSNLSAALTHYGTTSAPIYFGANYVTQRDWWKLGFLVSAATVCLWSVVGLAWWKALGWW